MTFFDGPRTRSRAKAGRRWPAVAAAIVVSAVAVVAVVSVAFHRDMRAARAHAGGPSRVVDSPWGPIEFADVGSGPPALMIHGSGGGFDQGLDFSAPLAREGVRVIAPSRFGYLRSAMPEGATVEMQADALDWLMNRLGIEQAVIIGGSAGALSATQLALRHPERCRRLVLVVPALHAPDRLPGANAAPDPGTQRTIDAVLGSDLLFWAGIRGAPDFMMRMVLATDPATVKAAADSERQRARAVMFHILPVSERREGLLMDSATAAAPPDWPVERIACPALVVGARGDLYETDKAAVHVAERIPDARLVMYPDGGHLWIGHDAELWRTVGAFVKGLPPV
ncbi:alpha/beta hydrolase [Brevundimonas sp.]|uniref:alpha/beta fold hydrolase n=1 Tax=Brevundimonas sp. TaxID=1871086 RepID=UPI002C393AEF|nr:alpha/beta hydrolase [Brevundimonas sp.]HWQ87052.1 alpha/beta hydrolase [Brevundimonas sp.]